MNKTTDANEICNAQRNCATCKTRCSNKQKTKNAVCQYWTGEWFKYA